MKYCEEYAALLDAYADGECSEDEAGRVREHLKTCSGCRACLEEILAMRDAFSLLDDVAVPEGFSAGVMAAVAAAPRREKPDSRRLIRKWLPRAACLVVLVGAVLGWKLMGGYSGTAMSAASDSSAAAAAAASGSEAAGSERLFAMTGGQEAPSSAQTQNDAAAEGAADAGKEKAAGTSGSSGDTARASGETAPANVGTAPASSETGDATGGTSGGSESVLPALTSVAPGDAGNGEAADAADSDPWASTVSPIFRNQPLSVTAEPDGSTYDQRLAALDTAANGVNDASAAYFQSEAHTENGSCIAYYGQWLGTSHVDQYELDLYLADGTKVTLPLPWSSGMGVAPPDSMQFDGDTFVYEITFSEYSYLSETEYHVQGTYRYTVDLTAQTVSLSITP